MEWAIVAPILALDENPMSPPVKSLPELLSFLDSQPEPRIVMDADYRIVAANRAYVREFSLAARRA